jgi:hypothetical protein
MNITCTSIGFLAAQSMHPNALAKILGVTSRGIFLILDGQSVVFLSKEKHCGPLSITLPEKSLDPLILAKETPVQIGENLIVFDDKWQFYLPPDTIWRPAPPPPVLAFTRAQLLDLAQTLLSSKQEQGLYTFLPEIIGQTAIQISGELSLYVLPIRKTIEGLGEPQPQRLIEAFSPLFGLGRGLTPSGDDFISGLILALNRYPAFSPFQAVTLNRLNLHTLDLARKKTTSLSTCLLQASTLGAADERFLTALDGFLSQSLSAGQIADCLLSIGNSSGLDMWCGVATILAPFAQQVSDE